MKAEWWRQAVLYHIYPLSFSDSNGDGFGDIEGIISRLDYLSELGVGAIWLSPIYSSPMADWGYDVADYLAVDPRFGSLESFDRLLRAVHERGMKLLLDFVPNHTSVEHQWFKESRYSRTNPKRDWYIWADPKPDGSPPNNWLSIFGGPAWTFDNATGQYYLHTFLQQQPDLNWRNPNVRKAMMEVLHFWLDRGVDGFRTDAVYGLIKDEQLRDNPPNPNYRSGVNDPYDALLSVHSAGQSELLAILNSFCEVIDEHKGNYLVSEAYLNVPGLHQLYSACANHPVHAPFNFNLMTLPWSAASFRDFINEYESSLGPDDWPNYVLGNHDRHRLVSRVGSDRAKLLAVLQLTLRGMPVIYYGDELGLEDAVIPKGEERDPFGIRVPGFDFGRDPARSPLPWDDTANGGFSSHSPWLPLAANAKEANVAAEMKGDDSFLNLYRRLTKLRSSSAAILEGEFKSVDRETGYILAYTRRHKDEVLLIILNFSDKPQTYYFDSIGTMLFSTHQVKGRHAKSHAKLSAYEGRIYRCI